MDTCTAPPPTRAQADSAARRRMLLGIASWYGGYRLGCWLRHRQADADDGGPPLFGRAGRTGYLDGYRDGLADATARTAS